MTSYYYRRLGQTLGPYDLHRMKQLARRKAFGYTSDVSTDGVIWKKGREFPELFEPSNAPEGPAGVSGLADGEGAKWSYIKDGVEHKNAVSLTALQRMVSSSQLSSEDLVWSEGFSDWQAVGDCADLADFIPLLSPPVGAVSKGDGLQALKAPAIALIVAHGLGMLLLLLVLSYWLLVSMGFLAVPDPDVAVFGFFLGISGIVSGCLAVISTTVALVASIMMLRGKSWGFSLTGAILSVIPCLNGCCLLSMPFGIWAIVILMKEETKTFFRGQ